MKEYQKVFEAQKAFFQSTVRHSTARERIAKLRRIKSWIFAHQSEIQRAVYEDFRKADAEVDLTELKPVLTEIAHASAHLKKWMRPKRVKPNLLLLGTQSYILPEPKGVVLILAPWNFPFMLTVGPLVSAIAAGNCAILKPSEMTPHTAELIRKMVSDLFAPQEVTTFLGDHLVAQSLLNLPFDHIFFTGSPEVGKKVMKAAANHLSSVTLELGGQNPTIVDESADLKDTAEKLVWGKYFNCGQSCMAPNYTFVHEKVHDPLLEELRKAFSRLYPENSKSIRENADFARVVNDRHFRRLRKLINRSVKKGAAVIMGGEMAEEDCFIAPTILDDVPLDAPVMQEEIFGPVLPIRTYQNIDEVLEFINRGEKPLALYIFSRNRKNIRRIVNSTSSGTVCINDTTVPFVHPNLPFGGTNYSGIGKAHGYYGFMAFSNEKAVVKQKRGFTSLKLVYPPYTRTVKRMIHWVLKYF